MLDWDELLVVFEGILEMFWDAELFVDVALLTISSQVLLLRA